MQILNNHNTILYNENTEAQELWRVTQPELDGLKAELLRIFNNTRVSLADIEGIEQWEKTLAIFPDLARDSLDERRDRVLEVLRTSPPFTENWFAEQMYMRFPNGGVSTSLAALVLRVYMDLSDVSMTEMPRVRRNMRELMRWLRSWIPANLLTLPLPTIRRELPAINIYTAAHGWRTSRRKMAFIKPLRPVAYMGIHAWRGSKRVLPFINSL